MAGAANPRHRGRSARVSTSSTRARKKNKPPKAARIKNQEDVVRGKEVSVRDSADEAQILYGEMRIGGNVTFIELSQDSAAYLQTGSEGDNNQLVFTAKTAGASGNAISIEFIMPPGNSSPTTVAVTGNAIAITLARSGSSSQTRLNDLIAAVEAHGAANALIRVQKLVTGTNGFITAGMDATPLSYGGGTWMHQMITLTAHEISGVDKLFLDEREVTFGGSPDPRWGTGIWDGKVFMAVQPGTATQQAQPDLVAQVPSKWTANHRQLGWSGAYLITVWNENVFPEQPAASFQVRGKPLYDPRSSSTAYSNNGALAIADFLMNAEYGFGIPQDRIHLQTWQDAANACDSVGFKVNGIFDVGSKEETLRQLEQAIAGEVVESGGMFYILPGVWRDPVLDLDENDLRGEVSMNTHVSMSDRFNCVRGTYVAPTSNYNITDFPPYTNSTYIAEDGRKIWLDLALNFVTDPLQAQKISKIELEKVRQGITLTWPGKVSCWFARIGENVRISYARFGFTNKLFKVIDMDFAVEQDGALGVNLILRETASAVFDWNNGDETEVDVAPNTNLPDPFNVPAPTNLTLTSGTSELYRKGDGTVVSRLKVSWDSDLNDFTVLAGGFEVQFKRSSDSEWSPWAIVSGSVDFVYILDVQDYKPPQQTTTYDVRVRAFNALEVKSAWVSVLNHQVIGKTAPPSAVQNFSAGVLDFGFSFLWPEIPDLDRDEYEIREGDSFDNFRSFVWRGKGTTARWEHVRAGLYNFWIKAIDTSGNYSTEATPADVQISGPGVTTVTAEVSGPNIIFRWSAEQGPFQIYDYILSYGPTYANSIQVTRANGNSFVHRVDWGGVRSFWVTAVDIAGNQGTPGLVTIQVNPPNTVRAFATQVVEQNVLLDWLPPLASSVLINGVSVPGIPVAYYEVYKGDTYEASLLIGTKYGTFHTYIERFGGIFTYHVVSVDTAGNKSIDPATASARVEEPDNFYIKEDNNLLINEAATLENAVEVPREPHREQNDIYFPIATTIPVEQLPTIINPTQAPGVESFQAWWDNNGWENLQEAVDRGYDAPFLAPTTTVPGRIRWLVDYEVTLSSSFINFQYGVENLGDPITFVPTIRISEDGINFEEFQGATQVFAENFRYVEYILDFQGTSDKAFGKLTTARAIISLKRETEYQIVEALAANHGAGGTFFEFQKDFLDVEDIQATVWGVAADLGIPIINFADDIANPVGARVLLFDIEGNPIDGTLRIQITGAVNP